MVETLPLDELESGVRRMRDDLMPGAYLISQAPARGIWVARCERVLAAELGGSDLRRGRGQATAERGIGGD
jgi:hypothetical protein